MKNKTSVYLMIAGIAIIIVGHLLWQNLNWVNAVDSKPLTININGIRSFPWPDFIGFVMFMSGLIGYIAPDREKGHRYV